MEKMNKVSVFAPASIGNVTVGFDVLGLAVKPIDDTLLGDVVSVEPAVGANKSSLSVIGRFADKLPSDPQSNIVWDCLLQFNQALVTENQIVHVVNIILDKKMPVGSGLGSSACSVVATLHALNAFYRDFFDQETMLKMMGQMEAKISGSLHYDNVAPCYYGGLQLMVPSENIITRTLPSFDDCYYVMAYPGIEVSTKAAREVLPTEYSRQDLIAFGQNLASFVDACHRNDKEQAFAQFKDVVAEPYRAGLLPNFELAKNYLYEQGSLAVGISGSGPTLFAVTDDLTKAKAMADWLTQEYLSTDLGFVHVCQVDIAGSRCL
ncbi:homoserine kinase [Thalassotalea atypica]|uniref:homoserine kinase n=1 Tax=Thalassotalea atypica TaxID=2054316 RepID=UPI0025736A3F|nr:homoserine kinase [Thalassotalea atypica]